jgi:uncharacterized membrane protein
MIEALINITILTFAVASQLNYSVTYSIQFLSNITSEVVIPVYGQVYYLSAGKLGNIYSNPAVYIDQPVKYLIIKSYYTSPMLSNVSSIRFYFTPTLFYRKEIIELFAPPGWGILNNSFSLAGAGQITKNNRIGVKWVFLNQTPFPISTQLAFLSYSFSAYPIIVKFSLIQYAYIAAVFGSIIVAVYVILFLITKMFGKREIKKGEKRVPLRLILSEDEKKVLSMIKKQEYIWQDELRNKTGFSKAKLSKIIAKLESLGAIKVQRIGKFNKIKRK